MSGYYAWRKRSPSLRVQQEPRLEAEVLAAHRRTRESFGPERLQKHLDEHGVRLGVHLGAKMIAGAATSIFSAVDATELASFTSTAKLLFTGVEL